MIRSRHPALVAAALIAALVASVLTLARPALAHPHVFIEAKAEIVYDGKGNVVAIRHHWRFDDAFSAFAIQGLDANGDGKYTREELSELADVNINSLKDWGYFTFGDDTKVEIDFKPPEPGYWLDLVSVPLTDYWAMSDEDIKAIAEDAEREGTEPMQEVKLLELHFTLPLKEPVGSDTKVTFDVYDPTYYIDFRFAKGADAVKLVGAPDDCSTQIRLPQPLDDETAARLAAIGADVREPPPELRAITQSLVNQVVITCGDAVAAAPAATPPSAADAVTQMAARDPGSMAPGGQAPSGAAPKADTGAASESAPQSHSVADPEAMSAPSAGFFSGIIGTVARMQSDFYQRLIGALRRFKGDPAAVWFLFLLSFTYGVFHAAGPGHGKAIITSYMFANEATLKRGVALSFAAAFVQASVAVAIVTVVALVLRGTSIAMKSTLGVFEAGSFALVALLGAWLVYRKTRAFLRISPAPAAVGAAHVADAHVHGHDHDHSHDHGHHHHSHAHDHGHDDACCGHSHAPDPETISGKLSLREAVAAVFSIGMRPCSGALVVLVFALSQGLYLAGVASAYIMAIGTALTISSLAIIAVTSRGIAQRIIGPPRRCGPGASSPAWRSRLPSSLSSSAWSSSSPRFRRPRRCDDLPLTKKNRRHPAPVRFSIADWQSISR